MRRLAAVLVAVGLAVWLAAPALSVRPFVPRAVEFGQSLPAGTTGGAGWRSGIVRAPKRFDLVGLTWRAPRELRADIRVRSASGRWSAWSTMGERHAGGPGAEPVWAGGADSAGSSTTSTVSGCSSTSTWSCGIARTGSVSESRRNPAT